MQIETVNAVVAELTPGRKIPKVSVCVITYNHEKYIAECLQSILDQETDFDFEIIVGDDCSTDGTREIVQMFAKKYPEKFRILLHPQNIGGVTNYAKTHELAIGEYVAHIDGDDLMLPCKLQKQVNALVENSCCVMATHDMKIINSDRSINHRTFKKHKAGVNTLWDLYQTLPFFAHSSKMVRRDIDLMALKIIENNTIDIEFHVAIAEYGNIIHIDEPLGCYRIGVGISAVAHKNVNEILVEGTLRVYERAIKKYPERSIEIKRNYARAMLKYAYQSALFKNEGKTKYFIKKSIDICFFDIKQLIFIILPTKILFAIIGVRSKLRYGFNI